MWRLMVFLLCLVMLPNPARASETESPRLSDRGRTLLAGGVGGYWSNNSTPHDGPLRGADWSVEVSPSFAHFIWPRIGLGAYASYAHQRFRVLDRVPYYGLGPSVESTESPESFRLDRFSVGAQSLWELVLAPRLGFFFWVTAGYGYERLRQRSPEEFFTSSATGATTQQKLSGSPSCCQHAFEATLFVPLTFHVSESVAVGFGPRVHWRSYFGRKDDEPEIGDFLRVGANSWIGASF
jgi:hypothetical protein